MTRLLARNRETILLALLLLLALALRLWALADVPPGWRDDELSNSLVISQKVLHGELHLFYADASGHEFLYHAVNALFLRLFGPGLWGIRLLSALIGVGVVGLTYLLVRDMFDRASAWIAALGVTTSLWSLMYSRVGQRHISALLFALAAFFFLWRALEPAHKPTSQRTNALLAGLTMGIGFYTYFASRISPAIVAALALYLALFDREQFRRQWRYLALTLAIAGALYLPLWYAAQTTPGAEARVGELAVPIKSAQAGDLEPLRQHVLVTLKMFHADGDDEWLYNVAHRPVFGPLGAVLFCGGLLLSFARALPRRLRGQADTRYALLLIWLAGALAPGVLAVPAASLGHTLLALPVAYLLPALFLVYLQRRLALAAPHLSLATRLHLPLVTCLLFLATETYRGLNDYFNYWPQRGYVRVLHNADSRDVARYLNGLEANTQRDVALGGALIEPWEQEALKIELDAPSSWRVRWFDPQRALVRPAASVSGEHAGSLILTSWPKLNPLLSSRLQAPRLQAWPLDVYDAPQVPLQGTLARFDNGLTLHGVSSYRLDGGQITFSTTWSVERPLDLPPNPLLSKPPPPGVPAGPQLYAFVHLLDASGAYVTGQDGLGVDPYTLQPGDRFIHLHQLAWSQEPPAGHTIRLGLYNPRTGQRWHTDQGADSVVLFTFLQDRENP
jgi:4-amino-4-deoxy-L-arabinose transferase-like glycosyltransferase